MLRCNRKRRTKKQIKHIDALTCITEIRRELEKEQLTTANNEYIQCLLSTTDKAISFIEEGTHKEAIKWVGDPYFWGTTLEQKVVLALLHWAE
jgi:RimJ/RimL family protein N-acetyltransferase